MREGRLPEISRPLFPKDWGKSVAEFYKKHPELDRSKVHKCSFGCLPYHKVQ